MRKRHTLKTNFFGQHQQRPANRWVDWAQMLYERHARVPFRSRGLAVVLAENRSMTLREVERRYFAPANFLSQIRLSIAPVLRGLDREVRSRLSQSTLKEFATLAHAFTHTRSERDRYHTKELLKTRRDFYSLANPPASAQRVVEELTNSHDTSAFVRIFNRFLVNRGPESTLQRNEAAAIRPGMQLIKRIVTDRKRLEENMRQGLVTRVHRETTRAAQRTVSERTVYEAAPNRNTTSASWVNQNSSPVNIEQLTEQVVRNIDGRIVAHRERLGKVF